MRRRRVTVFRHASQDICEQNTHADFTVKLAHPVDLGSTSNWEMGVCKFCVPPRRQYTKAPPLYIVT